MAWFSIQYLRKKHFNFGGKFEFRSQFSYYNCIQPGLLINLRMIAVADPFSVPSCLVHYCQSILLKSRLSRALYTYIALWAICTAFANPFAKNWVGNSKPSSNLSVQVVGWAIQLRRFALQKSSISCTSASSFLFIVLGIYNFVFLLICTHIFQTTYLHDNNGQPSKYPKRFQIMLIMIFWTYLIN